MDYGISGESIICFAGEDWWYHHPHSKNHILKRLAQQNRVLFVNSLGMGLPSVSNPDFFLKIRRKLKSYSRWLKKVPEGLWVMTPIVLPFYGSPWAQKLNRVLLSLQLRIAMRHCGMSKPIVWAAIPSAADAADFLRPKLVIYQVSDKYDANEDSALSKDVIRELHRRLINMAGAVLYSGRKLFDEAGDVPHRVYLQQAVDYDHFANQAQETALEIVSIPHPVLGYFGAMDFVMDIALMMEVARRRPDWHWIMIGMKSNLMQAVNAPNIHFLGTKPYSELPRYLRHFDICVLPWNLGSTFTAYGSAIKVREYLASGKPIVMAPLFEYLETPGIRFYNGADDFIAKVEDALANDSPTDRKLRQSAVHNCTWDVRAREVGTMMKELMAGNKLPVDLQFSDRASASAGVAPQNRTSKEEDQKCTQY
jgi:glycosyltransferase involved in cell wall biosynthesis